MYCKNCGNQLNEDAVACIKCGCDPKNGDKNCPTCGVETSPNQIICVKCGVPLKNIDATNRSGDVNIGSLLKNKQVIFALVALIGFLFLGWTKEIKLFGKYYDTITDCVPFGGLLYIFPVFMIGVIVSYSVPQIAKFRKILSIASVLLVCYALLASECKSGFGLHVSLIGAILSAYFGPKKI